VGTGAYDLTNRTGRPIHIDKSFVLLPTTSNVAESLLTYFKRYSNYNLFTDAIGNMKEKKVLSVYMAPIVHKELEAFNEAKVRNAPQ
jgi:hypothetical protein